MHINLVVVLMQVFYEMKVCVDGKHEWNKKLVVVNDHISFTLNARTENCVTSSF